jgi:hypothetical protein
MLELAVSFVAGLVVGWNLLPQPDWVKEIYDRVASWVRSK